MPDWIDTHCHLDAREFAPDRDAVVERARAAGVRMAVLPAVDVHDFEAVRDLAHRHGLAYALGIHPMCSAAAGEVDVETLRRTLDAWRDDARLVAVGEIGLDHFVPGLDREHQRRLFAEQLKIAEAVGLPVLLHTRKSADPVARELRRRPRVQGIAHAFNGSEQQARVYVELGFKLGFGGSVTFERALHIRRLAQSVPLESIVTETDAPDIAPQWRYRTAAERAEGATMRNEPAELPRIAAELADLRGLDADALAAAARRNAVAALPKLGGLLP